MALPMPYQYFHILNFMLMLNLGLWAYTLGLTESYFAQLIFCLTQLMFQGLRELSIALSDPYGFDATDFPLAEWTTGLHMRIYALVEEQFHIDVEVLARQKPLRKLRPWEDIVDVHIDLKDARRDGRLSL
eukprot:CAMPEP_0117458294 /NCGR_PEP_ID=MMETSP0784-20121206/855_1 /TAXON_ID=39447 /ORGANISM="" /LENGTH=129 /DNA_ID=CAMNT_0005251805 /DNA_START=18 /DNA_END=407 /DNA_ORIENTATION=-